MAGKHKKSNHANHQTWNGPFRAKMRPSRRFNTEKVETHVEESLDVVMKLE